VVGSALYRYRRLNGRVWVLECCLLTEPAMSMHSNPNYLPYANSATYNRFTHQPADKAL
jgi:hypothetical protein